MSYTTEEVIETVARAAHEANRAYCLALGDTSQVSWDDAPQWQKESTRIGAAAALDPDQTPEKIHEKWMAQKSSEGWVYGKIKDSEAKTHPCMIPYEDLPIEQQAKDDIFLTVCRAIARVMERPPS